MVSFMISIVIISMNLDLAAGGPAGRWPRRRGAPAGAAAPARGAGLIAVYMNTGTSQNLCGDNNLEEASNLLEKSARNR